MRIFSFRRATFGAACGAVIAWTSFAAAQSTEVIPPAYSNLAGDSNNRIPIGSSTGGTYQVLYPANQLVGLPIGGSIRSIQMRLRNAETTPWPPAASVVLSYEIKLGGSTKTPATLSTTFADNITSPVIVRSGGLFLGAGAYPAGAVTGTTPEAWGPEITFSTPYVYSGGPLVVEFRNTGTATAVFGDAVTSTDLGRAIGSVASNTATTGGFANAMVIRLGVTPPSTRSVTLPTANESVAGFSGNYIPIAGSTGGRQMTLYAADQLAAVPAGSIIVGVQLRQRNAETSAYPAATFTSGDYEIWLCRSNLSPGSISSTFADNILEPVRVRDGTRTFAAGEFPGGAASDTIPENWGPLMVFDTPYVYRGGVLGLEFRNTGGGPDLAGVHYADIVANGAVAAGLAFSASPTNPTGALNGAIIARFTYFTPVESPYGDGVTKIVAAKQFADTVAGTLFVGFTRNQSFTSQCLVGPEQFQTVGPGTLLTGVAFRN